MASVNEDREGKRKAEGKQELSVEGAVLPHTCRSHTWPGRLPSHVKLRRLVKAKLTDSPLFSCLACCMKTRLSGHRVRKLNRKEASAPRMLTLKNRNTRLRLSVCFCCCDFFSFFSSLFCCCFCFCFVFVVVVAVVFCCFFAFN